MTKLEDRLAALATMSPAQLRQHWRETFRNPAPELSTQLLALAIAHNLQQRRFGGLSSRHGSVLAKFERRFARTGDLAIDDAATLKSGAMLVRSWGGKTHRVLIQDEGYVYQERRYRSLSEIARLITGTSWSGPRFFGLKGNRRG